MFPTTTSAGAMPVAAGATPAQSYPVGPGWAAYRLPFPSAISARAVGVCFGGEPGPGGANPPAAGAPGGTPPAPPAPPDAPAPPATGDPDLGEAGKKAIAAERKAAKESADRAAALQAELEALKASSLTDAEKAQKEAVNAATAAERAKWQTSIREVRVEAALRVAGASNDRLLDLALRSDVITALKVDDAGKVIDLDKAIAQLKADIPEMFAAPSAPGSPTRGAQPGSPPPVTSLEGAVAAHYAKH